MANAQVVNPAVSLTVEKETKATPVDQVILVRLSNFRGMGVRGPRVQVDINALESTMSHTGYHQWDLNVDKSYGKGREYEVSLKLTDRSVSTDWHLKVAVAFINSAGHLVCLSQWRNFQTAGKVHKFLYGSGKLDNWADGNDLKLLIWFTTIPSGLRDESFEQQFGSSKEHFKTFQSTVKGNLFNTDMSNGLQRYCSQYHIKVETFERIFDSGWLPSCFNFGDSTTDGFEGIWMYGSTVKFHAYAEWIRSGATFHHVIRSAKGHEWLLTVTPGVVAHEITLTAAHLYVRRFRVHYGFGSGMVDGFALGPKGSVEDVRKSSSPRFIWDRIVVNNCVELYILIEVLYVAKSVVLLISTEGKAVGFYGEMFANSDVIQAMMKYKNPDEDGDYYRFKVHFDTETLCWLRRFIMADVTQLKVYFDHLGRCLEELLLKVYSAAEHFHLPDVQNKVESILDALSTAAAMDVESFGLKNSGGTQIVTYCNQV